jgi:citrate lyase beta subunit
VVGTDPIRVLLFVPAGDERKLARALASSADLVVVDLEDAVAEDAKDRAREEAVRALAGRPPGTRRAVRVNGAGTPQHGDDLAAVAGLPIDLLVLPKAEPAALDGLGSGGPPVLAIVETARGLRASYELAAAPRVAALMLGAADLGAELALVPRADGAEVLLARSQLVLDSAAAGILQPVDGVFLDIHDTEGLERESRLARSLGMGGKACIHPAQLEAVRRAFTPDAEEVAWAREVVRAAEEAALEGRGVVTVAGQMVDAPVLRRARRVLAHGGPP